MIGLARGLSHRGGNNPPVHTAPRDPPPANVSNHNPTKRFGRRRAAACTGLAVVLAGLLLACLLLFHYFRSSADTEVLNVTQPRVPSVVSSTTSAPQIPGEEPSAKPNEGGIGSFFSPHAILGKLAEYHNVLQDGKARSDFEEKRAQLEAMLKDPLGHVRQRLEERKGLGMPHGRDERDNDDGTGQISKDEHKKEMRRRMLENLERMSRDLKEKRQALVAHPDGTPLTDEESHRLRELKENQLKVDQMLERIRQQQREEAERDERQRRTSYFSEDQMKRLQQVSSEEGKGRHLEEDHRAHNAVLRTDGIAKEVERHRAAFDAFSEAQQREHLADALRAAEQHRANNNNNNNNRNLPPRHGDKNSLLGRDSDPEGKQVGVPNAGAIDAAELRDQQAHTLMGDALAARVRHDAIPMDLTGRRSYEKQDSVQSVHSRRTNEGRGVAAAEDTDAVSHRSPPTGLPNRRIRLALFSTLKPCEGNDEARYAQLDAVMSWALLPLNPHIYLLGRDSCHAWVAAKVNRYLMDTHHKQQQQQQQEPQHNWKSVVQVVPDAPSGPSGTILLGPAIALLAAREPDADLYGFLNADILLHPVMVPTAVEVAMQSLREFFLIGRRLGVTIPKTARASFHQQEDHDEAGTITTAEGGSLFSVTGAQWYEQNRFTSQSRQDRIDAEDYFFWTNDFFRTSELEIPPFHIGRPAYDNWLVHHAIHTWKPVLDASELFLAYHQTHGYQHLEHNKNDDDDENKDSQTDKKGKKSAAYWGKQEQQENYDLGITHGGWQHGLIEYSPLQFLPEGCGAALAANKQMRHQGGGGEEKNMKSSLECEIGMGDHWKPFGEDAPFRTKEDARLHYARFSRRP